MQRKQQQQCSTFQCPPVFLISKQGSTILLLESSDVQFLMLDDDDDVLTELDASDVQFLEARMDHMKSRIGRA